MKKLLVVSHAGVLEVNREVFRQVARQYEVDLKMVVPAKWKGSLIHDLEAVEQSHQNGVQKYQVVPVPVLMSGNGSLYFYGRLLSRALDGFQPDIIFLDEEPWSVSAAQVFSEFKDCPRKFFYTKQNLQKRIPRPFEWLQSKVFDWSNGAFAVTQEVAEVLIAWKKYSKVIQLLPHSYDPKIFKPIDPAERSQVRSRWGVPSSECQVVSYFGRLTHEKGMDEILDQIERLRDLWESKKAFLLMVGSGPSYGQVQQKMDELQKIGAGKLIDAIPHHQVGQAIASTDMLLIPSRTESFWKEQFGRIIVEALACQVPVIGSDSGEIPRLIARAGGGVSVSERNGEALGEAIRQWVKDPARAREFGQSGYQYVTQNLTHEVVAQTIGDTLGLIPRAQ